MQSTAVFGPIEIWKSMGIVGHLVLIFLFLMSAFSVGVMIDRWLVFRKAHRQSFAFIGAVRELLAESRFHDVIQEARKYPRSHVARIYSAALLEATPWFETGRMSEGFENAIRSATDREGVLISQDFKRGLPGLASIGATAPFVGLFGTVVGIMNSFFAMARTGTGGIGAVSGGIAEALVNTAAGILVALPAVWAFNSFLGSMERIHSETSNASSELVDYLVKNSRSDSWTLEATTGQPADR